MSYSLRTREEKDALEEARAAWERHDQEIKATLTAPQREAVEALEELGYHFNGTGRGGDGVIAVLALRPGAEGVRVNEWGHVSPRIALAGLEKVKEGSRRFGFYSANNWAYWRARRDLTEEDAAALKEHYGPARYRGPGRYYRGEVTVMIQGRRALVTWFSGMDI